VVNVIYTSKCDPPTSWVANKLDDQTATLDGTSQSFTIEEWAVKPDGCGLTYTWTIPAAI